MRDSHPWLPIWTDRNFARVLVPDVGAAHSHPRQLPEILSAPHMLSRPIMIITAATRLKNDMKVAWAANHDYNSGHKA